MAIYKYSALSSDGQRKNSALIAANMQDAYQALKAKKLVPISISRRYYASKRISIEDTLLFFMHINFQLACGVTIDGAIDSFAVSIFRCPTPHCESWTCALPSPKSGW